MSVAVVGDVVASRRITDQVGLLRGLDGVLDKVNADVPHLQALRLTVRDEFRGVYANLAEAVEAALRLRLEAAAIVLATAEGEDEQVDVRLGIGEGVVVMADAGQPDHGQSGSAWWCARDALDAALTLPAKSQWPASTRVVYRSEDPARDGLVNAWLLCQDQLFARLDLRDRRALLGLLNGERQIDIANDLGITQPAVARRLRDRGALALKRSLEAVIAATSEPSQ